jgi:sugar phosphate permease
VGLSVFASLGLARFGYTSILPAMQDSLRLSNAQTGALQSWNLVGYLLTVVLAGMLSARYGPRVVISTSLLITALAMMLTGLFPWFENVRLGRFLAGVGGAGGNVPAMALISAWFGSRRRGLATGAGVGGSSVGLMVTGPLVPLLLNRYGADGWRVSWFVLGGIALAVFGLCALFLRNRPEEMGLTPVGENEDESIRRAAEKRAGALDWSLVYQSRTLWHLAVIFFAFGFSYIIYSTFFIRYLVKECGFTQSAAGLLWLKIGMLSGLSGFIWGGLSDRWGRRLALANVFLLQGAAFLILGLSRQLPIVYISAGLFALTAWSVPALMAALAGDVFGARLAPAALGLVTVIFGIGQAFGPYFAGRIADATHSFSIAFLAAGTVALTLGAGGSWLLPPMKRQN